MNCPHIAKRPSDNFDCSYWLKPGATRTERAQALEATKVAATNFAAQARNGAGFLTLHEER